MLGYFFDLLNAPQSARKNEKFLLFGVLEFLFYVFSGFVLLHLGNRGGLGVVGLEVALEVEDLELILLGDGEELAERSIGLDDLLLHETLLLGVGAHGGGHLAAAHESTLGLAEEHAESIADAAGLGEDAVLLGLLGTTLHSLAVAAALAGLLELTGDALLKLLHLREDLAEGGTELVHLLHEAVELGNHVDLLSGSRGSGNSGHGLSDRGCNDRRSSNRRCGNGSGGSRSGHGLLLGVLAGSGSLSVGSAHLMSSPKEVYDIAKRTEKCRQICSLGPNKTTQNLPRGEVNSVNLRRLSL